MNVIRKVRVYSSDRIISPITYGILKPKIIIPSSLKISDKKQLKYMLTHEMIHIKYFDIIQKIFASIVLCIHWFNPLVWVLYQLLQRDIEIACDEATLSKIGECERTSYAYTLLSMEEKNRELINIQNGFGGKAVKTRIMNIVTYKKSSLYKSISGIVIAIVLTTLFASTGVAKTWEVKKVKKGSISDKYQVTITHDFEMLESKFIQYDDFNSDELKKITVQEAAEKGIEGKLTLEELYCKGLIGMPLKEYLYVETNDEEERVFGGVYLIYDCRELYKKGFVTQVNEVRAQHRSELFYMNLNVSNEIINFADNYV